MTTDRGQFGSTIRELMTLPEFKLFVETWRQGLKGRKFTVVDVELALALRDIFLGTNDQSL